MTVTELIARLQTLPADSEVVLSKDAEGNGFSPLYECTPGYYEPDSTYSGEFTEAENGGRGWTADTKTGTAIALWPVN